MVQSIEFSFENNQFLVISISSLSQHTSKVTKFNPDSIVIPGDKLKTKFKLKAAIIYLRFDENSNIHSNNGHYTCWIRDAEQKKWLEISDSEVTLHERFVENLDNVYLLFLEKIL